MTESVPKQQFRRVRFNHIFDIKCLWAGSDPTRTIRKHRKQIRLSQTYIRKVQRHRSFSFTRVKKIKKTDSLSRFLSIHHTRKL